MKRYATVKSAQQLNTDKKANAINYVGNCLELVTLSQHVCNDYKDFNIATLVSTKDI